MRTFRLFATAAAALVTSGAFSCAFAAPSTVWTNFPIGPFAVGTPVALTTDAGTTLDVTVVTGGTQGVNGADIGTLGVAETGLDYTRFTVLGVFNGGGSGSVPTSLTFSNIHVGPAHARGLLMVGAINGNSSPVTVSSSVAGRVQTWSVVGSPFDYGPSNSFPLSWDAGAGTVSTTALSGNDSRCIVLDLGDLRTDGTVAISLNQNLNDGIVYSLGEELTGTLDAPAERPAAALSFAAPRPNPVRGVARLDFTLPAAMHARLDAYDVGGRRLATILDADLDAGAWSASWDAHGAGPASGLCFLRLETRAGAIVRRVLVLR